MLHAQTNRLAWNKTIIIVLAVTIFVSVVLAIGGHLLAISSWQDLQHQAIRFERLKRYIYWKVGLKLHGTPHFASLEQRLASHNLKLGAPVFIRIFKRGFQLEVWIKRGGHFHLFETYPICKWSGRIGPKLHQGDRQAPEGFYTVNAGAMNPASRWHRSFNLGFPNAYDRQHQRTGSYLMVHGGCSSIGCYAVTNNSMDEIWKLTTAALKAGQRRFHVHVYPFRMSNRNLSAFANSQWHDFWLDLKDGYDAFEKTHIPPKVFACKRRYVVMAVDNHKSDGDHSIRQICPPQKARFTVEKPTG